MTFKKNLLVMAASVVLVLIGSYLVDLPWSLIVGGITLVIPTVTLALMIEDFMRKAFSDKEKLSWQYYVGVLLVLGSIIAFLWAATSVTNTEMVTRLGVVFLLGGLGGFWFHTFYKNSIDAVETREAARWEKAKKRLAKAKSKEKATKILHDTLRYQLVGDSVDGDLDFNHPIAIYREEIMTFSELMLITEEGGGALAAATTEAGQYIDMLVAKMGFEEEVE